MRHRRTGSPLKLAALGRLPLGGGGLARMQWLAELARRQALGALTGLPPHHRICALLSIPPTRPGLAQTQHGHALRSMLTQLPGTVRSDLCGLYDSGHEGGIAALGRALDVMRADQADVCLVGGFDSLCDADLLDWLAETGRLKDDRTPNGIVPGEAAAFVLLASDAFCTHYRLPSLGRVLSAQRAVEPAPWYTGQSTQGHGLTRALAAALEPCREAHTRAEVSYCDLNGESWRADEWSYAYLRTAQQHGEPLSLIHPADCWGDVGAATAPLLLATALCDMQRGRVEAERVLLWCASDTRPYRGAALIEGPQRSRSAS
jgi:3-oxoacyl-[acyl-carrier-protein] synthase-1